MNRDFEAYVERTMPGFLRAGVPPETWTGTADDWEELTGLARSQHRQRAAMSFVVDVSEHAFYPDELASGQLRPGAEIYAATGKVKRPVPSPVPAHLMNEAQAVLMGARGRQIGLIPQVTVALELAGSGNYHGDIGHLEGCIAEARRAVNEHDNQGRQEQRDLAARKVLTVHATFNAVGHTWQPGSYRISDSETQQLSEWKARMETEASRRNMNPRRRGAPWPPFSIEAAPAAAGVR
jgi:hypothetical protein